MSDSSYPEQVQQLHDAILQLQGVDEVELGIQGLEGITTKDLSLPGEFADLPHVALMRTDGGLKDEVLITATLQIEPSQEGWIAVEFLAWWVRDHSRSGDMVQMRPLALPPVAYGTQLGQTLTFVIEFFFVQPGEELDPILDQLTEQAKSLTDSIDMYRDALDNPADPDGTMDEADTETLIRASEGGVAEAQFELARRYQHGIDVEENPAESFRWYSESAKQGFPPAIMFMGYCYAEGIGVEVDDAKAVEHYRESAEAGFAFAKGMLGQCYERGAGVELDESKAAQWYRQGAEEGAASCLAEMGRCYEDGIGVEPDLKQALEWYEKAHDEGLDEVEEAIERVEGQL